MTSTSGNEGKDDRTVNPSAEGPSGTRGLASGLQPGGRVPGKSPAPGADSMGATEKGGPGKPGPN
ncbi:hypothetical protein [Gellertiella hungarica]|uniref:Uncharacterized protein n=1 Tax=Gellertiella hungarica TaxID=1572859 RepID=A0A7W6NKQ0_9HYPH|nr:hypothetical protein [Gellertiella hungarica]MBB4064764.1 hypothetical protein [Gellertiella hungarica]